MGLAIVGSVELIITVMLLFIACKARIQAALNRFRSMRVMRCLHQRRRCDACCLAERSQKGRIYA